MGRQSTFKKLRRLARKLPAETTKETRTVTMMGREIIRLQLGDTQDAMGNKILPNKRYKREVTTHTNVDHYANLKKAMETGGLQAIKDYISKRINLGQEDLGR